MLGIVLTTVTAYALLKPYLIYLMNSKPKMCKFCFLNIS